MDIQAIKPNQLSIYWRSIVVIILITFLFSIQSCAAHHKYGAATPDRVVERYLTALEDRNDTAMRRLMPEQSATAAAVTAKIDRLGGYKIQDRQIEYTKPRSNLWSAKIQGFYIDRAGAKRRFDDSIGLAYQSKGSLKLYAGRWYLLLEN